MPDPTVVRPAPPSPLERLVDDYLMACRAKGLAPTTVENSYGYPLRGILLPWCAERGVAGIDELTPRQLNTFAVHLQEHPGQRGRILSKHSIHATYLRSVRLFLAWCEREGEAVKGRPALPRLPRKVLDVLDREELQHLIAAAPTERDRLILAILADCGLRNSELCSLRLTDVVRRDRRQAFLHVQGKGSRERLVPLPPALLRAIERYERHGRPRDARGDRLFIALRRGASGDYKPLSRSGVLKLVKSAALRAGITKPVHAHLLRHSFVTNALRGGMNPMLVAQIAGHSSFRMIEQVYSHLTAGDSYEALIQLLAKD